MIAEDPRLRVFARATPTDMRKSFDTLAALVTQEMGRDPMSGDLYLFVNQGCRVAKVLFWDGSGLVVLHKRISSGRFAAPWKRSVDGTIRMSRSELSLFLEGSQLVFIGALSPPGSEHGKVAMKALVVR